MRLFARCFCGRSRLLSSDFRNRFAIRCFSDVDKELVENKSLTAVELRQKLLEKRDEAEKIMPHSGFKYPQFMIPNIAERFRRGMEIMTIEKKINDIPREIDIVIVGGGIIGSAIAAALKNRMNRTFTVLVLEKDIEYTHSSTGLSIGGIRQQFSLPENIRMAMYSAEYFRNLKKHCSILLDQEPPDIEFNPQGYLFLANEDQADIILDNHELQTELGVFVDVYNKDQLKQRFPWMNTNDVVLGSYGLQNEGWFNPRHLLLAMKGRAEFLGAQFLNAEVIDFNLKMQPKSLGLFDEMGMPKEGVHHVIIRSPNGELNQVTFSRLIIAAGPNSREIAEMLRIGEAEGLRKMPLPVEPRKRYVFAFNCNEGPGIDFPFLVDPSGVYCRRDGLGGNFLAGKVPTEEEEPDSSNLEVDYSYFDQAIRPVLANRVPAFKNVNVIGAWAGYHDYNVFDQSPIIGLHPYYWNVYFATGFGGHGVQMAPAVGNAIQELILDHEYKTIDLTRFGWERLLVAHRMAESILL